jgi:hypothetical protein|tara:strand:+ start:627 stop:1001 length:375 start_codon:yes stop_codon:yes gene_type:complete
MEGEEARRILWRTTIVVIKTKNQIQNARKNRTYQRERVGGRVGEAAATANSETVGTIIAARTILTIVTITRIIEMEEEQTGILFTTVVLVVKQTRQMTGDDAITITVRTKTTTRRPMEEPACRV